MLEFEYVWHTVILDEHQLQDGTINRFYAAMREKFESEDLPVGTALFQENTGNGMIRTFQLFHVAGEFSDLINAYDGKPAETFNRSRLGIQFGNKDDAFRIAGFH